MIQSSPAERARAIALTTLVGALCNTALSALKIVAGLVGHSHALVADGIHSLSDLSTDLLVWIAGRQAAKAPDALHPYGHERYETFATLLLAGALALVAAGIGWDAIGRLFQPERLPHPGALALSAALVSILVNEALFWFTLRWARRVGSDMLRANAWHHRSDAISSIVVLIGIAGTMAGLDYLDAVASVLVAVMIARIAWDLGAGASRELVDTGLDEGHLTAIRDTIRAISEVRDLHMLRTRTSGGRASADVHILVDPYLSVSEGHRISVAVEQRLKRQIDVLTDITVHIDIEDDEAARPHGRRLPPRTEVLARLERLFTSIPEFPRHKRLVLHYLDGAIEVELLLPPVVSSLCAHAQERIRARFRAAAARDALFRRVDVYFG